MDENESQLAQLLKKYPAFVFDKQSGILTGTINVDDDGMDTYDLVLDITPFPSRFPIVKEGGRIPPKADRHVNNDDSLCFTPMAHEQLLLKTHVSCLIHFFDKVLVPFLRNNSYYEIHKVYRNDAYSHGIEGVIEMYYDMLCISRIELLIELLGNRLKKKQYPPNAKCFCGRSKKFKDCHSYCYNKLFKIDIEIINFDLERIKLYRSVMQVD